MLSRQDKSNPNKGSKADEGSSPPLLFPRSTCTRKTAFEVDRGAFEGCGGNRTEHGNIAVTRHGIWGLGCCCPCCVATSCWHQIRPRGCRATSCARASRGYGVFKECRNEGSKEQGAEDRKTAAEEAAHRLFHCLTRCGRSDEIPQQAAALTAPGRVDRPSPGQGFLWDRPCVQGPPPRARPRARVQLTVKAVAQAGRGQERHRAFRIGLRGESAYP